MKIKDKTDKFLKDLKEYQTKTNISLNIQTIDSLIDEFKKKYGELFITKFMLYVYALGAVDSNGKIQFKWG